MDKTTANKNIRLGLLLAMFALVMFIGTFAVALGVTGG
jgi:hypothetical protein